MRPVFCGNFEHETRQSDLERLFSKYGRVDRVDIKSGFAFIYFEDERDAEDAIRGLDNRPFGYDRRKLSVEWAKGERGHGRDGSRAVAKQRPTKTLFVINFDPAQTKARDIERHFEPYGKVLNVRVRRNFAFVQFETQEEATKALKCTHNSKILDRMVSVEYALRDDGERDERDDNRSRGGSGKRGDSPYGYRRSPSPPYQTRPSPDYGYGGPRSPDYGRSCSPDHGRSRSPDHGRSRSPDYGRSRSPGYGPSRSPDYGRSLSPGYGRPRSPGYGLHRSPDYGRRRSPDYGRPRSPDYGRPRSPNYGRPHSPDYGRSRSPIYGRYNAPSYGRTESPEHNRFRSRSPLRRSRT